MQHLRRETIEWWSWIKVWMSFRISHPLLVPSHCVTNTYPEWRSARVIFFAYLLHSYIACKRFAPYLLASLYVVRDAVLLCMNFQSNGRGCHYDVISCVILKKTDGMYVIDILHSCYNCKTSFQLEYEPPFCYRSSLLHFAYAQGQCTVNITHLCIAS